MHRHAHPHRHRFGHRFGHGFAAAGFGRGGFGFGFAGFDEAEPRGGRRRQFDGAGLRLILLRLIADAPRHGYDLIRAIEERTGGAYAPSAGVVYPTLTLLAEMELIAEAPAEGARKIYAATEAGERLLVEKAEEVAALMARLDALGAARERPDVAAVRRAMHNLKAVLRHRLGREAVPAETLHEAVALIDEVARRIERL
ncbi:PadR family transcriptional regulator [Sphingomonas morindae]